jgi:hypothetical protein
MKKQIEMCDYCEDEEAVIKITKGSEKGTVLCDDCFADWKEGVIEDMYEDIK